jgi:hypothetical protein
MAFVAAIVGSAGYLIIPSGDVPRILMSSGQGSVGSCSMSAMAAHTRDKVSARAEDACSRINILNGNNIVVIGAINRLHSTWQTKTRWMDSPGASRFVEIGVALSTPFR